MLVKRWAAPWRPNGDPPFDGMVLWWPLRRPSVGPEPSQVACLVGAGKMTRQTKIQTKLTRCRQHLDIN